MSDDWKTEFRKNFFSLDEEKRKKALELKNQHIPNKLYCYLHFSEHFWENLKCLTDTGNICHAVRMSHPTSFNDPYDTWLRPDASSLFRKSIAHSLKQEIREVLDRHTGNKTLEDEVNKLIEIYAENGRITMDDFAHDVFTQEIIDEVTKIFLTKGEEKWEFIFNYGVKCFSERWDSLLMWGHYGHSHTGVCFEYDMTQIPEDSIIRKWLYPVYYAEKMESIFPDDTDVSDSKLPSLMFVERCITKSDEWEYEKEWRLIRERYAGKLHPFPIYPTRIYLGTQISREFSENSLKIRGFSMEHKSEIMLMGLALNNYKLYAIKDSDKGEMFGDKDDV